MTPKNIKAVTNFVYEAGILAKTPRSGLWFLGTGSQSVAEHLYRTTMIGYALSHMVPKVNRDRLIFLCLVHDFAEGRTSDLNYVHQKYGRLAEANAFSDIAQNLPFGKEMKDAYTEEQTKETIESKLAKDADQIEWIATLCEEETKGNKKARAWAEIAYKRLKTPAAKKLGKSLLETHPDNWWFDEKDVWFVDRKAKKLKT
ncbi:MAG: Metal dependent phosphohydrolase [Parcubacteria group bacterium GW2011_GWC2_39_14]|nr:MAG: Metal dependent phosphohydrolase [Parcubacteria group bacterium GW2011_GWC2_39_14]